MNKNLDRFKDFKIDENVSAISDKWIASLSDEFNANATKLEDNKIKSNHSRNVYNLTTYGVYIKNETSEIESFLLDGAMFHNMFIQASIIINHKGGKTSEHLLTYEYNPSDSIALNVEKVKKAIRLKLKFI